MYENYLINMVLPTLLSEPRLSFLRSYCSTRSLIILYGYVMGSLNISVAGCRLPGSPSILRGDIFWGTSQAGLQGAWKTPPDGFFACRYGRLVFIQDVSFEPGIAERAARIQPFCHADEVSVALVERGERRHVSMKNFAPVRTRLEGGQGGFDLDEYLLDRFWLALPGEMNRHTLLVLVHAHP